MTRVLVAVLAVGLVACPRRVPDPLLHVDPVHPGCLAEAPPPPPRWAATSCPGFELCLTANDAAVLDTDLTTLRLYAERAWTLCGPQSDPSVVVPTHTVATVP